MTSLEEAQAEADRLGISLEDLLDLDGTPGEVTTEE